MKRLEFGVIGNCSIAALIDAEATIVWACFPRLDGEPAFSALVDGSREPGPVPDGRGIFSIRLVDEASSRFEYVENSAILRTVKTDRSGGSLEIIDFAPRFSLDERVFRPPHIVRRINVLSGRPRITIIVRPTLLKGPGPVQITRGSNHIRYLLDTQSLRLTTNAPISYIIEEKAFLLEESLDIFFGSDERIPAGIENTARDQFERTQQFWRHWVRSLSIPFEWQDAVIRAAITLKLCNFEETGAIVAALTTSIPEAPGTERNWDYRFCWLRDAYFVIHALNRLGVTTTMEGYIRYINDIVEDAKDEGLRPVYGISRESDIREEIAPGLAGYLGYGPVRFGNAACGQVQNDVYGSVVLASAHAFFDRRLTQTADHELFRRLERMGHRAIRCFDQPDAGPWELRTQAAVHTFSAVMCWAACDRLAKIAHRLKIPDRSGFWRSRADAIHAVISARAWNDRRKCFVSTFDGDDVDATLLLLCEVDFLDPQDPRFAATVAAVERDLRVGNFMYRYATADDFGKPETAFVICTFWFIDALVAIGRREEARLLFENILAHRNSLGLLSEDIDPDTGSLWGNFPQTYSMVGLINSATRLSLNWEQAF